MTTRITASRQNAGEILQRAECCRGNIKMQDSALQAYMEDEVSILELSTNLQSMLKQLTPIRKAAVEATAVEVRMA